MADTPGGGMTSSTALVPVKRAELDFGAGLPVKCRTFLELYVKTRRLGRSAKLMGISGDEHRRWLGEVPSMACRLVPGYREAYELALADVQAQEDDILLDTVEKGLKEVCTDEDGNVKYVRHRQSEGIYKMYLQGLNRAKYGSDNDKGSANVVIVINRPKEGW